jgi:glycosyltransferase involved in cell wall biosynthesis
MNSIYFLSDNYKIGGLETHIHTFLKFLKKKNPQLNLSFSSFFQDEPTPFTGISLYSSTVDLSKNPLKTNEYGKFFLFKEELLRAVLKKKPDLIVSHPFYSFFSAFYSAVKNDIPLVIFLHGKLSTEFQDPILDHIFHRWIVPNALVFTVNPSLGSSYYYLPNPIDDDFWLPDNLGDDNYILIVSRLDWEKAKGISKVLNVLHKLNLPIKVVGTGDALTRLKREFPKVSFLGACDQMKIKSLMEKATLVCGMGRVALEALFLRKAVLLVNYEGEIDIIDSDEKFLKYALFNFNGSNIEGGCKIDDSFLRRIRNLNNNLYLSAIDNFRATVVIEKFQDIILDYIKSFAGYPCVIKNNVELLPDIFKSLSQKQEHLIYANKVILNKENELSKIKEQFIEDKKKIITELTAQYESKIKELENELLKHKEQKASLEEENNFLVSLSNQYYASLRNIQNSKSWKLISRYWHFKAKALNILKKRTEKNKFKKHVYQLIQQASQPIWFLNCPLVDWNIPLFQRPHHIALNLAKLGHTYFYSTTNTFDRVDGIEPVGDHCYLTNKFSLLDKIKIRGKKKIYHIHAADHNIDIQFLEKRLKEGHLILYEYMDEIHPDLIGNVYTKIQERHKWVLKNEDIIVVSTAKRLYEEVSSYRSSNHILVPNGVDYDHFSREFTQNDIPSDIREFILSGKPIVGYFGAFAKWFDYALMEDVVKRLPNFNFLLLGWDYDGSLKQSSLSKRENVKILGPIDYKTLPRYAYWFDVALIPFRINDVTLSTSPIKLFEYFALGKPVVSTPLPEVQAFDVTLIASEPVSFAEKIKEALALKKDVIYIDKLRKIARENSWLERARSIQEIVLRNSNASL